MCGIVGFIDSVSGPNEERLRASLIGMVNTLEHRGPDDDGQWIDGEVGVAIGHRRLAIVDLSSLGRQPMISESGRFVITYNGEIYNFRELRAELEPLGHRFRGHSDTEVILAAIEEWGLTAALERFVGMFSFGLWDKRERVLHLARDRLGEKPLYYGWINNVLLFGSELKALRAHPQWRGDIDYDVLKLFLRFSYVPAPYSIYKGISKLLPGTFLTINGNRVDDRPVPTHYWPPAEVAENGTKMPFSNHPDEIVAELDDLLRAVIGQQMIADVPLGAFLSGGIDSSTIVALMQAQSDRPVNTFTVGFHEAKYNEAEAAKAVAQHLGTNHIELYVTPQEIMDVIPRLPALYDEPFADSSQIPTFLIAKLARQHVTVSLSGDGGDELFGGYNRYHWGPRIWRGIGWLPKGVRRLGSKLLTSISPASWDKLFGNANFLVPRTIGPVTPGNRMHHLAEVILADDPVGMYRTLVSHWRDPCDAVLGSSEQINPCNIRNQWLSLPNLTQQIMYLDMVTYLPDDILVKVDRATMGVSLEARAPFLDHRVAEFAWKIPLSLKIRDGQGKWLLRQVLYQYVPRTLVERPKAGFAVPLDSWLRGPLREWAETLLANDRLEREGFFNPAPIRKKWLEHLSGQYNWQYQLWDVLMFQAWLETQ